MKQHRALCILIVSLGAGVAWYVTAKVKDGRISQLTTRESGLKDEIRDLKADHGREMQRVRQDRDKFELISRTVFPNAVPSERVDLLVKAATNGQLTLVRLETKIDAVLREIERSRRDDFVCEFPLGYTILRIGLGPTEKPVQNPYKIRPFSPM